MPSTTVEIDRTQAVQELFDVLVRFSRSLRARGADWGNVVHDLTRGDIVTLGVLESRGSIRPGQIAVALSVDPSVISRQLTGLARLELITRGTDPADGRAELITLAEAGRVRLERARSAMSAVLAERLDHWGLEDIALATSIVDDLDARLHEPICATDTTHTTAHDTGHLTGHATKDPHV